MIERGQIRIPVRVPDGSWDFDVDIFDAPEKDFRRFVLTKLANLGQINGCWRIKNQNHRPVKEEKQAITEKEAIPKERG